MPNWKKVIVSGSDAALNSLNVTNLLSVTGSSNLTGSLNISGSASVLGNTGTTTFYTNADTLIFTGSVYISGSIVQTGSLNVTSITSSLFGTASWAQNSITSSYAVSALSASYAPGANTAISASYAATASSADAFNVRTSLTASGLRYPTTDGVTDQFLSTDGAGNLTFDWVKTLHQNIRNRDSVTIVRGTPLFISGSTGDNADVYVADASNPARRPATIIAFDATLAPNATGTGILSGEIQQVNTNGYPAGTVVYLATGGGWTVTRPTGSSSVQVLGVVTLEATNGRGIVFNQVADALPNIQAGYTWVGDANGVPQAVSTSSLLVSTASFAATASLAPNYTLTSSFNSYTSSTNTRIDNLESFSSSLDATFATDAQLNALSSSFTAYTSSINSWTGSTSSQFGGTASFASTASSADNFLVRGTLTAQTIVAQTITSSTDFVTGSTKFGTLTSNTHQFTGSVSVSGSLAVNGFNVILTNQTSSMSVATASYVLNAVSASYAVSASHVIGGVDPFPYTGNAQINGGLGVSGSVGFAYEEVGPSAWSAGGALSTARYNLAGAGTQNAGLAFGGYSPLRSCTEEYNGTSWSSGGALITAKGYLAGAGTQNAGLAFGGSNGTPSTPNTAGACTEEYNGSSWSAGGALITGRFYLAGAGTQNAGLAFGGDSGVSCTEEYDGSSWSTGGALITARAQLAGAGTQNAGLAFGGVYGIFPGYTCTEEYNGTAWSAGGALSTARYNLAGAGTQNAGLAFGGYIGYPSYSTLSCTEEYNGSSWSSGGTLITARSRLAGAGTQNAGLAFGGYAPSGIVSCTEEYSSVSTLTKTFDYSSTTGAIVLSQVSASLNFADDTAAAAGGIPLGGLYRNGNFIAIRLT